MQISCSHCQASYEVDAALIPDDGREVKCSQCETVWLALPVVAETDAKKAERIATEKRKKRRALRAERIAAKEKANAARAKKAEAAKQAEEAKAKEAAKKAAAKPAPKPAEEPAQKKSDVKPKLVPVAKTQDEKVAPTKIKHVAKNAVSTDNTDKNDILKKAFQKKTNSSSDELVVSEAVEKLSQKASSKSNTTQAKAIKKPSIVKPATKKAPAKKAPAKTTVKVAAKKVATEKATVKKTESAKITPAKSENSAKTAPVKPVPPVDKVTTQPDVKDEVAEQFAVRTKTPAKPLIKRKRLSAGLAGDEAKADVRGPQLPTRVTEKTVAGATDIRSTADKPVVVPKVEGISAQESVDYNGAAMNFYSARTGHDAKFLAREDSVSTQEAEVFSAASEFPDDLDQGSGTEVSNDISATPKVVSEPTSEFVERKESKFWLGFGFVICFALLAVAIRYMAGPIAQAIPATAPYLELYNSWFDMGLAQVLAWVATAKDYISGLVTR